MHEKREKANEYNAKGSPEMREADDEKPGFKKAGAVKKGRHKRKHGGMAHETQAEEHREEEKKKEKREHHKDGGHVMGHESKARPDKRPRRAAGGRTPYSSASATTKPTSSHASDGHESDRPSEGR